MRTTNGSVVIGEIRLVDGMYVGYHMDREITRQNSSHKCYEKMASYMKGQK